MRTGRIIYADYYEKIQYLGSLFLLKNYFLGEMLRISFLRISRVIKGYWNMEGKSSKTVVS